MEESITQPVMEGIIPGQAVHHIGEGITATVPAITGMVFMHQAGEGDINADHICFGDIQFQKRSDQYIPPASTHTHFFFYIDKSQV